MPEMLAEQLECSHSFNMKSKGQPSLYFSKCYFMLCIPFLRKDSDPYYEKDQSYIPNSIPKLKQMGIV